jgi:hypothetical protein
LPQSYALDIRSVYAADQGLPRPCRNSRQSSARAYKTNRDHQGMPARERENGHELTVADAAPRSAEFGRYDTVTRPDRAFLTLREPLNSWGS